MPRTTPPEGPQIEKPQRDNEKAERVNPENSGIRTGNPQLERHEHEEVELPARQRPPRQRDRESSGGG